MATALDILKRAAGLAGEKAFNQNLNPIKEDEYLALLNDLHYGWENDGINLNLSTLTSGDTLYVDDADLLAIRYNLATLIMEHEGSPVKPTVFRKAEELETQLRAKYHPITEMELPEILQGGKQYDINTG